MDDSGEFRFLYKSPRSPETSRFGVLGPGSDNISGMDSGITKWERFRSPESLNRVRMVFIKSFAIVHSFS